MPDPLTPAADERKHLLARLLRLGIDPSDFRVVGRAIEARATADAEVARLTAERDALRAALGLAVDFVDRVQQFGRLTRADAVAPGPMEKSAAVLATTLRAALATPAAPVAASEADE